MNTQSPVFASLPPELVEIQRRWLRLKRGQQDALYANEFAPRFAELFRELPLHGAPNDLPRPRALVSMLGFSWQPVALMAAWARPEQMLVIGTKESLAKRVEGESVVSLIARIAGLDRDAIVREQIGDPGETEIYRAVRDFLRTIDVPARRVFVDPTGGKKSMSAAISLAAFLAGTPLVYVDYGEYDPSGRIPKAGTEYPRLLANPLAVLGDLELVHVFNAFDRGDFTEAEHLSDQLAKRLYEPREAECLALLSAGYGAWDRFEFADALSRLEQAQSRLSRFAGPGKWTWATLVISALQANLPALRALVSLTADARKKPGTINEGAPLLAWYLARAQRLLAVGKTSLAALLTYAAVERYIDLCLWVDYGLDDDKPDYSLVESKIDNRRYDRAGRQLWGKNYTPRALAGPLMFTNGAQLLVGLEPARLAEKDLGPLKGLAQARNKCEYEHGLIPQRPDPKQVQRYIDKAHEIIARASSDDELKSAIKGCHFPSLSA